MSKPGEAFERAAEVLAKLNHIAISADAVMREIERTHEHMTTVRSSVEASMKETINARSEVMNSTGELRSIEKEYRTSVLRLEGTLQEFSAASLVAFQEIRGELAKMKRRIFWQTVTLLLVIILLISAIAVAVATTL